MLADMKVYLEVSLHFSSLPLDLFFPVYDSFPYNNSSKNLGPGKSVF